MRGFSKALIALGLIAGTANAGFVFDDTLKRMLFNITILPERIFLNDGTNDEHRWNGPGSGRWKLNSKPGYRNNKLVTTCWELYDDKDILLATMSPEVYNNAVGESLNLADIFFKVVSFNGTPTLLSRCEENDNYVCYKPTREIVKHLRLDKRKTFHFYKNGTTMKWRVVSDAVHGIFEAAGFDDRDDKFRFYGKPNENSKTEFVVEEAVDGNMNCIDPTRSPPQLPAEWSIVEDTTSGGWYYTNATTKASQWHRPSSKLTPGEDEAEPETEDNIAHNHGEDTTLLDADIDEPQGSPHAALGEKIDWERTFSGSDSDSGGEANADATEGVNLDSPNCSSSDSGYVNRLQIPHTSSRDFRESLKQFEAEDNKIMDGITRRRLGSSTMHRLLAETSRARLM